MAPRDANRVLEAMLAEAEALAPEEAAARMAAARVAGAVRALTFTGALGEDQVQPWMTRILERMPLAQPTGPDFSFSGAGGAPGDLVRSIVVSDERRPGTRIQAFDLYTAGVGIRWYYQPACQWAPGQGAPPECRVPDAWPPVGRVPPPPAITLRDSEATRYAEWGWSLRGGTSGWVGESRFSPAAPEPAAWLEARIERRTVSVDL